ncbi:PAS domain S-box protein [Rhodohalobacter sp.]|uniref:sensor histidine kinase n=1 Tax=Rhodohalobacter sp. TaxID=1974210 RepID=UPI002ACD4986|nr:PAS domain S-box protein [Rhodohalobacter sp.]MDZ7758590.1 PAS domain S-box protein [Rhodohalobacter sp.]
MMNSAITQEKMNSTILDSIGEAVVIVDPSGRIIRNCNSVTEVLFGYSKSELIGQKTSILHVNREHFKKFGEESEKILNRGDVYKGEFQMKRKDGSIIDTYNTVSSLNKEQGWEEGVVSVIRDVTDQKETEKQLQSHVKERSILLAEMHHRVKNNLAVIAGLLYIQIESSVNEAVVESLKTSYCRLQSIAQVHEQLYKDAEMDANISLNSYLHQMAENVDEIIILPGIIISVDIQCQDITIPLLQAVPLGLLLSELLVNAYKHAFEGREKGRIQISCNIKDHHLNIDVSDNGIGLPEGFSLDSGSIGMEIVQTLTEQLNGRFSYTSQEGKGTAFTVSFIVAE